MDDSKKYLKTLAKIWPFLDFIYILQLEEYDFVRYLKRLPRFFFRRDLQKRATLKFTKRVKWILVWSIIIYLVVLGLLVYAYSWLKAIVLDEMSVIELVILLALGIVIIPLEVALASIFSAPLFVYYRWRNKGCARELIKNKFPNLKIVGITGSFGKTTTKHYVYDLVKDTFRTQMVPGNINSAIGIADWLNSNLLPTTEVLVVEMGAYKRGDIKNACSIAPPDIAVITAFGDQHMERFGSLANLKRVKLEIFENARSDAELFINSKYYDSILMKGFEVKKVSAQDDENKALAIEVAKALGVPEKIIKYSTKNLTLPERRGNLTEIYGFAVIDNSYNINLYSAKKSIEEARKKAKGMKKKLMIVTAGIPEVGKGEAETNQDYVEFVRANLDEQVFLESVLIKDFLTKDDPKAPDIKAAWQIIQEKFNQKEILILMQPELTDLYY